MKIFISWSGATSHKIGLILRDWLPSVLQATEPYLSSEDIDKGARWSTDISRELSDSDYGILCVTRDNLRAPWLNFEAGALSKSFDKARVSPFLFGIDRADVTGPLLQFQSTVTERDDVFRLVHSINAACEDSALESARLDRILYVWWPTLHEQLKTVPATVPPAPTEGEAPAAARSREEVIAEMLELIRSQQRLLSSPEELLPPSYIQHVLRLAGVGKDFDIAPEALMDLDHSWTRLQLYMDEEAMTENDPTLRALVQSVHDPVRYITLRAAVRRRRPPASRRTSATPIEVDRENVPDSE